MPIGVKGFQNGNKLGSKSPNKIIYQDDKITKFLIESSKYGHLKKNKVIDHINHDTLDNRKQNLRICDTGENIRNVRIPSNNTSGYRGVVYNKINNNWYSRIMYKNKRYYCGTFSTAEEAAIAYNKKARELYGEFANLNEVKI